MSADDLERIVLLVAELSRAARKADAGNSLAGLARRFGVPAARIARDIRTLTTLGDHAETEWLLSLSAWQQGDRVWVSSLGPFRRPVLLSPDERLALLLALALDPEGARLAARLGAGAGGAPTPGAPDELPWVLLRAVEQRCRLEILYAGEGDTAGRQSVVQPHELVGYHGRTYLHAWDESERGWRFYRVDRFLDAVARSERFTERDDFEPVQSGSDLFRAAAAAVERVRVRFSPAVAPRVRERYPRCEDAGGGAVLVTFLATSVEWLVRRVLEYGPDAEVLDPPSYREAVRRAVVGAA